MYLVMVGVILMVYWVMVGVILMVYWVMVGVILMVYWVNFVVFETDNIFVYMYMNDVFFFCYS